MSTIKNSISYVLFLVVLLLPISSSADTFYLCVINTAARLPVTAEHINKTEVKAGGQEFIIIKNVVKLPLSFVFHRHDHNKHNTDFYSLDSQPYEPKANGPTYVAAILSYGLHGANARFLYNEKAFDSFRRYEVCRTQLPKSQQDKK